MYRKAKLFSLVILLALFSVSLERPSSLNSSKILELVNSDRQQHGLESLELDPLLSVAAQLKAKDMIEKNYFAHISPEGLKPWYWFKVLGYNYTYAGENLAIGFSDASELEQSWMGSPQHRANILSPYYSELGLAVVPSNDSYVVVQFFGSKINRVSLRQ
ncbi:MAG: hypothetical protein HY395_01285 [Candidatus Doudnabacteria bacterium]|nr:hypothetical protein [Candidatus Doudnabacteria bacterium]